MFLSDGLAQGDEEYRFLAFKVIRDGVYDAPNAPTSHGVHWEDGTPARTKRIPNAFRNYNLGKGNEFPIITLRRSSFKSAVEEMLWMWQKNSNRIEDIKTNIWDSWATKKGTIGKAYGYQLGKKYQYDVSDEPMTQVEKLFYDLTNRPNSRRIICTMWNPEELHEMTMEPCAHTIQVTVMDGKLNMLLTQRSQDIMVAGDWNIVQYVVLQLVLASIFQLEPGVFSQIIGDAHIYDRHIELMEQVIAGAPHLVPKFGEVEFLSKEFTDRCKERDTSDWKANYQLFQSFTVDMFTVPGYREHKTYNTHPFDGKIPVAI